MVLGRSSNCTVLSLVLSRQTIKNVNRQKTGKNLKSEERQIYIPVLVNGFFKLLFKEKELKVSVSKSIIYLKSLQI